jgi:two-component system, chemotaxis family, protein-glutamate methylesterase/glutaminase
MTSVLVVDDSAIIRRVLGMILRKTPAFGELWMADSAAEGIRLAAQHTPDLVLMDVRMPGMDGVEAIHLLQKQSRAHIVLITGATNAEFAQYQIRALAAGALEVIAKPDNILQDSAFLERLQQLARATQRPAPVPAAAAPTTAAAPRTARTAPAPVATPAPRKAARSIPSVVGIVSSTGGPQTLQKVLSPLERGFPACILLTQHITEGFEEAFVRWLATITKLSVCEATQGTLILPGWILVAPPNAHLTVRRSQIHLDTVTPPFAGHRPAGNPMLASLAGEYGSRAWGVVLTGMGTDGALGMQQLQRAGGHTIAQDAASAVVDGMPRAVRELGAADVVLSADEMGKYLSTHIHHLPEGRAYAQSRRH